MAGIIKMFPASFDTQAQSPRKVVTTFDSTALTATPTLLKITPTAYGVNVILPPATSIQNGTTVYVIKNCSGLYPVPVRNPSGRMVANLLPFQICELTLIDNATSEGVWAVTSPGGYALLQACSAGPRVALTNRTTPSVFGIAALSSKKVITVYRRNSSNDVGAQILDVSAGDLFSAGSELDLGVNSDPSGKSNVAALTPTQAVCVYQNTSTGFLTAATLNVSGSSVTNGTPLAVTASAGTVGAVSRLSDTTAIVFYCNNSGHPTAVVLTISGTTITAGTPVVILASSTSPLTVVALTSTKAVVAIKASTNIYTYVLDISGTVVTPGTQTIISGVLSGSSVSMIGLTDTSAVVAYSNSSGILTLSHLSINSSTVTAGSSTVVGNSAVSDISIAGMSATSAIATTTTTSGNFLEAYSISINGTSISAYPAAVLDRTLGLQSACAHLSGGKYACVYSPTSTTTEVRMIEGAI